MWLVKIFIKMKITSYKYIVLKVYIYIFFLKYL